MLIEAIYGGGAAADGSDEEGADLRRGPWTPEEDRLLVNYVADHGEGRWNSLAVAAGLKRTGKSCRLRWLNYLRPDLRRGNITLQEQLLILELHTRYGNRWSKIAQHLPGRTDNEIKNYWRTRVQKHAKQLKCDVNSQKFKNIVRYLWMPRLLERIQAAASTDQCELELPVWQDGLDPNNTGEWKAECPNIDAIMHTINPSSDIKSCVTVLSIDSTDRQLNLSLPMTKCNTTCETVMEIHGGCNDMMNSIQFDENWTHELFLNNVAGCNFSNMGLIESECGFWGENMWGMEELWNPEGL